MLKTIDIEVSSYALMVVVGIIAAVWFIYCRSEFYNIKLKTLLWAALATLVGMAIGSRIVFVISQLPIAITAQSIWWVWNSLINGGFVFYGGLFGALAGAWFAAKRMKLDTSTFVNYFLPGFPVFHFFGRIGCFLAGCCYGIPFPVGIVLPEVDDQVRIPVQLIESLFNLIIVAVLLIYEEKSRKKGKSFSLLPIYLLMYAPFRFILEFFRGDELRGSFGIFSTSQWISIITIITVIVVLLIKRNKRKKLTE